MNKRLFNRIFLILSVSLITLGLSACGDDINNPPVPPIAKLIQGKYQGIAEVTVGGEYTYEAPIEITITAAADEVINVNIPEYSLANTLMGDLTLGSLTISDVSYDKTGGLFSKNYGGTGLRQHFKAVNHDIITMDRDYPLNDPSVITIEKKPNGEIAIDNSFKLGAMPFSLNMHFEGKISF